MSLSERKKEIRQRRHRRKKVKSFSRRAETANASEKTVLAQKIRKLTSGAEDVIIRLNLEDR